MVEKRKFPRVPVNFFLQIRPGGCCDCDVKVGVEGRTAQVLNISEGGLGILTDSPLPEETKLDIEFHLALREKTISTVTAIGQVCYNIPLKDRAHYHTGVEFIMIKEKDQQLIAEFIKSRSQGERAL